MKEYFVEKIHELKSWNQVKNLTDFKFPWLKNEVPPKTSFKAYHNKEYLFFQFTADDAKKLIYIKEDDKLEVTKSERVEIFFRQDSKMNPYYCLEIDPRGRVLDYKAKYYREFERKWKWPDPLEVSVNFDKASYKLEGKLRLTRLIEYKLLNRNIMEVGLFRGNCTEINGDSATIKWISWVDPMTLSPDFHVPSSFGKFVLEN